MVKDIKSYYKDVEILFCDCDKSKQARIQTIMRIMADIAGDAYAARGYSHTWLFNHNTVFLITRASVRIHRMPVSSEVIKVETWEKCVKGILCYRDFIFYDKEGEKIIEGQTAWVNVDPVLHSIKRPSDFPGYFNFNADKAAETLPPARLKPKGELKLQGTRKIVYSDIDGNNHTYNAVYVGIACDFLPAELLEHGLKDFRINFKKEALLGDVLSVYMSIEGNMAMIVGKLDNVISFETEFKFAD